MWTVLFIVAAWCAGSVAAGFTLGRLFRRRHPDNS